MSESVIALVTEARAAMVRRRRESACQDLFDLLDAVKDPEIPVLSIWELGVLQDVRRQGDTVTVVITPTYSGCPAMDLIAAQITECLRARGIEHVEIETQLSPAWSTDWMDSRARAALHAYGIAPPDNTVCPQCGSEDTVVVSEYGSTACKALYRCRACQEPFDHFKAI